MISKSLKIVGFLEGVSFLVLLGIAIPVRYFFGNGSLVPYAGMAHGVLFLAFLAVLLIACHKKNWPVTMFVFGLIAAVLPFGTFVFDYYVGKREREAQ